MLAERAWGEMEEDLAGSDLFMAPLPPAGSYLGHEGETSLKDATFPSSGLYTAGQSVGSKARLGATNTLDH